jgi:long-chain acyl-CoA synthetase
VSRILDNLDRWAHERPDAPALEDGATCLTWTDLQGEVADAARWLGLMLHGLPAEAPVAVALDNGPAWLVLDLALIKQGRPSLPLPPFFTPQQRRAALADAGACLLLRPGDKAAEGAATIAGARIAAQRLGLAPRELHPRTAKITYTSGSTGSPKGVCLSLDQMEAVATSLVEVIGAEYAGRHLALLPLGVLLENVAGFYATLLAGGCYDARPLGELGFADGLRPDARKLADVAESCQATSLILTPELLRGLTAWLAQSGRRLPRLNLVAVGGAKVAPQLLAAARAVGLPAFEGYGLSECGSVVALNTPHAHAAGHVGRALPHLRVTVEQGEIVVGPAPFLGYVGGAPQVGAVRTGDLGAIDTDRWLTVTGRKSNVLITAFGRNVAPEWIESELLAEPEIAQVAVFGEASASLCALLVPSAPAVGETLLAAAVQRANGRLPVYARVERWRRTASFDPSSGQATANGRPRRAVLQAAYRDFIDQTCDEPPMTFSERLERATGDERAALYAVPQLADGLRGRITIETYLAYLGEAYHHVSHTVPLLAQARDAMDENHAVFRAALDEYIAEEAGHDGWILGDIANSGGDAEAVSTGAPAPATASMIAFAHDYIARVNPMGMFGMIYVLESVSVGLATAGAHAVSKSLGLGSDCFTYLSSHGALDREHLTFFNRLMEQVDDPADQSAIVEMARRVFALFADLFRAIPHQPELVDAT